MSKDHSNSLVDNFIPYQYSILRYTHDLSSEEFVNVGILLMRLKSGNVHYKFSDKYSRISSFFRDFSGPQYKELLSGIKDTLNQLVASNDGLFERQDNDLKDLLERISQSPQSCFSWSSPRGGIAENPSLRLRELFEEYVTYHQGSESRNRIDEKQLRRAIIKALVSSNIAQTVDTNYTMSTPDISHDFAAAWKNGMTQVLEPVSFDFKRVTDIQKKATQWRGLIDTLAQQEKFKFSALVAPPPIDESIKDQETIEELNEAFQKAVNILEELPMVRKIIQRHEMDEFTDLIRKEIEASER